MKLEVAVAELSQSRKGLTIEVPVEEVKAEFEKTYDAYSRYAKVPGFRPGRVPRGVVKQRFAKDVKEEVIGRLLPHALQHAIIDNKLDVVGEPEIDDIEIDDGGPLRFKATVDVIPEFELREYKGLSLTRKLARVTDEQVAEVIERRRQGAVEFVPVEDRPSQAGDIVSFDLKGKYVDQPDEEDISSEDIRVELGSENIQPEFDTALTGVKAGDVKEFRVTYPEDYDGGDLAGKTLDFTATVISVRQKDYPEIDDDFAKEHGDAETLAEMRGKIRANLTAAAEKDSDSRLDNDLVDRLIEPYDFEIPASLIEKQAADRTREFAYMMLRSGMPREYLNQMDWEKQMGEARKLAVKDVRAALVVSRIGDAEKIEVAESDIDAEIQRMAESNGEDPALLKDRLTKNEALSSIENRLRYKKVLDFVRGCAEISTEELVDDAGSGNDPDAAPEVPPGE